MDGGVKFLRNTKVAHKTYLALAPISSHVQAGNARRPGRAASPTMPYSARR